MTPLWQRSATQLVAGYRAGEFTPVRGAAVLPGTHRRCQPGAQRAVVAGRRRRCRSRSGQHRALARRRFAVVAGRRAHHRQGQPASARHAHPLRQPGAGRPDRAGRRDAGGPVARGRRADLRQDQRARVRDAGHHRQRGDRRHRQPLEPGADPWRLIGRRRSAGGRRRLPAGAGAGRRRVDPAAGLAHQPGGLEALATPRAATRRHAQALPRLRGAGADRALRGRCRRHAAAHRPTR